MSTLGLNPFRGASEFEGDRLTKVAMRPAGHKTPRVFARPDRLSITRVITVASRDLVAWACSHFRHPGGCAGRQRVSGIGDRGDPR